MNALKFLKKYLKLFESDEKAQNRKSILDPLLMLAIKEHPQNSKADFCQVIFGDRLTKRTSLDRPLNNLIEIGFVEPILNVGAKRKKGEGSKYYQLTQAGIDFLKSCK